MLAALLLFTGCVSFKGQQVTEYRGSDDYDSYVRTYYPLAVEQMKKYGIPASITLAQGLLESGAGKSELSRKSNNHFGIKADKSWKGRTVSSMDSKFLVGRQRYAFLFELESNDYKGWAKGLKQAGYAEDSKYPQKLINLIERYNLQRFDISGSTGSGRVVRNVNGVPYIIVEVGDRMTLLAGELGLSVRKLRKYNDIHDKREPVPGERLFIKKKKGKAAKGSNFHTTASGESLYTISQEYGIRLMKLYDLNPQYRSYTKLKVGDIIRLR